MDYLESKRLGELHRRNERMSRGLGSFIEGKSTLSGWQYDPDAAALVNESTSEGDLNPKQQPMQLQQHMLAHNAANARTLPNTTLIDTPESPRENIEARPTRDSSQHIERPLEDRNGVLDTTKDRGFLHLLNLYIIY
jgi:hypothetical protein